MKFEERDALPASLAAWTTEGIRPEIMMRRWVYVWWFEVRFSSNVPDGGIILVSSQVAGPR
jgi:hypothetical protein